MYNKNQKGIVLVVDDNEDVLNALDIALDEQFDELILLNSPNQISEVIRTKKPHVVLLDMNFSSRINTGNEGIFWLREILSMDEGIAVVLFTAYGDVKLAVKAMKEGAMDFVLKPWDNHKLLATLRSGVKLAESKRKNDVLETQNNYLKAEINKNKQEMLGNSIAYKSILNTVKKIAPTEAVILIGGENGTGKSMLAKEIHDQSDRSDEIFVSVDLGAINENLFESELFGYKKGAFTDAKEDRMGRIQAANKGTLFLDEVGNLSLGMQQKLLTVLETRKVTPLGSAKTIGLDIRLISATNQNLEEMIEKGSFREDLYYRLNTIKLEMPSLRDRIGDVDYLAIFFFKEYSEKYHKTELSMSKDFIDELQKYYWPGNIRELKQVVEKAVILCDTNRLSKDDFQAGSRNQEKKSYSGTMAEIEKAAIMNALMRNNGSQVKAAKELSITRQTIYNKIKKYDL
jgi:two-component system, NtrC family, response regulator HydG